MFVYKTFTLLFVNNNIDSVDYWIEHILGPKMSDEENDRFEEERRLLNENFKRIPHTPSTWEEDIYNIDEDPNPHGKN